MTDLKQLALQIFHQTIAAIDIPATMRRKLHIAGTVLHCGELNFDLREFAKFRVIALGKAAGAMLSGLTGVLPAALPLEGIVVTPASVSEPLAGLQYFVSGHPVPNAESWKAAETILSCLKKSDEKTLVFFFTFGRRIRAYGAPVERSADAH